MPLDQCFGIPNNTNNNKNNSSRFHLTERNSDIPKHSSWYIITGCAGVWVGSRRLQEETEQLLHATFSSVLLAFCWRSAANTLTHAWKMSWGNSIYEHVIGPPATNVFPLGPYLNLTRTDSLCGRTRHYYPAAWGCHLFPFGTGCSIIAPTPTR